jgi:Phasin protein
MSKTRTGRPASRTRSARRSLVELTAAASRAADDGLLVMPDSVIAASPEDPPRSEHATKTSDRTVVARQATVPIAAAAESPVMAVSLVDSDSTAEMAVKIAKDYQNRVFENIKVGLYAALDHAKDLAETRVKSEAASNDDGGSSVEDNFLTFLKGAEEFRAEAIELMKANVITTLEFTRQLAGTTTVAEFVELSTAQAPKHCELILKQADALRALAQTILKSSSE